MFLVLKGTMKRVLNSTKVNWGCVVRGERAEEANEGKC